MNNKLDLEVFKSRCACLTEILSSYREGLLLLESCDLKVEYNKVFTLAQFLSLTNQTKAMFEFNEDIKYSGC